MHGSDGLKKKDEKTNREASTAIEIGNLSMRENLVMTSGYVRP